MKMKLNIPGNMLLVKLIWSTEGKPYFLHFLKFFVLLIYKISIFSVDKVTINLNSVIRIVIIDNWIIKITLFKVYVAHQNNCVLIVHKTDTHMMSPVTRDEVQYINIKVTL